MMTGWPGSTHDMRAIRNSNILLHSEKYDLFSVFFYFFFHLVSLLMSNI